MNGEHSNSPAPLATETMTISIDFAEWLKMDAVCKAGKEWLSSRHPANDKERRRAFDAEVSLKSAVERQSGYQE
jgi:hypothetical protein